jgi:hypothetical protein
MLLRRIGVLAIAAALLMTVGCTGQSRRPVNGTVTFKGTPVKNGVIRFLSKNPPGPAGGAVIVDGRYDIPAAQGINAGTYSVFISYPGPPAKRTREEVEAGASTRAQELLPAKYNTETTLQAEIKSSGNEPVDFRLE